MRVYKFLVITLIVTLSCLLYVHQQFVLVKVSYAIGRNESAVNQLLDQNKILEYNVSNLKSPLKLSDYNKSFQIAKSGQVIKPGYYPSQLKHKEHTLAKAGAFNIFKILTPKREAEARTVR